MDKTEKKSLRKLLQSHRDWTEILEELVSVHKSRQPDAEQDSLAYFYWHHMNISFTSAAGMAKTWKNVQDIKEKANKEENKS